MTFSRGGILHGPVRLFRADPRDQDQPRYYLSMIGSCINGLPSGPFWILFGSDQQTFQYFEVADDDGGREDKIGAYIYPDLETAIVGRFVQGVLESGGKETT